MQSCFQKHVESNQKLVPAIQRIRAGGPGHVRSALFAHPALRGIYAGALMMSLFGCQTETEITTADQLLIDRGIIRAYAKAEGLTLDSISTGVYYSIEDKDIPVYIRPGGSPYSGSWVLLTYTGKTLDGTPLGNSGVVPDTFTFSRLMPGLQTGLGIFKKTQSGFLLIPSTLAYKAADFPEKSIPANAIIRIDLTLVDWGLLKKK